MCLVALSTEIQGAFCSALMLWRMCFLRENSETLRLLWPFKAVSRQKQCRGARVWRSWVCAVYVASEPSHIPCSSGSTGISPPCLVQQCACPVTPPRVHSFDLEVEEFKKKAIKIRRKKKKKEPEHPRKAWGQQGNGGEQLFCTSFHLRLYESLQSFINGSDSQVPLVRLKSKRGGLALRAPKRHQRAMEREVGPTVPSLGRCAVPCSEAASTLGNAEPRSRRGAGRGWPCFSKDLAL